MSCLLALVFSTTIMIKLTLALLVLSAAPRQQPPPKLLRVFLPNTNLAVVEFATTHVGQQVGSGDCVEFLTAAKNHVESLVSNKSTQKVVYAQDYRDGKWVRKGTKKDILPGDIFHVEQIVDGKCAHMHVAIVLTFGYCDSIVTAEANAGSKNVQLCVRKLSDYDKHTGKDDWNRIYFDRLTFP